MNAVQVVTDERAISVEVHDSGPATVTITHNGTTVAVTIDPEHRSALARALAFGLNQTGADQ